MKILVLTIALLGLYLTSVNAQNPSDINLALDYAALNTLKDSVVKPMVEKIANVNISSNITSDTDGVHIFINNIIVQNATMDYDQSYLLTVGANNAPTIQIKSLTLNVLFDAAMNFGPFKETGTKNQMNIVVDANISLGFKNSTAGVISTYLLNANIPITSLNINFNGGLGKIVRLVQKKFPHFLNDVLSSAINGKVSDVNKTLLNSTSFPTVVSKFAPVELQLSLVNFPQTISEVFNGLQRNVLALNWKFFALLNNTPYNPFNNSGEVMPNYRPNFAPVQLFVHDSVLQTAAYTAFALNKVQYVVSDAIIPESSPLKLSTTDLTILFPFLVDAFGPNLGVYVNISKGGDDPIVQIRDGKLDIVTALNVSFIVDEDSSHYPKQGLAHCTTCKLAVEANLTTFISLNVFSINSSYVGLDIINVYVPELQVLAGRVNGTDLQTALNYFLPGAILYLNRQTEIAIKTADIGKKFGLNATAIALDEDRLVVGVDFENVATIGGRMIRELIEI